MSKNSIEKRGPAWKKSKVDNANLEEVRKRVIETTGGLLKVSPNWTQEMHDKAVSIARSSSHAKIEIEKRDGTFFMASLNHVYTGHTKGLTDEDKRNANLKQMKDQPKGECRRQKAEHLAMSKLAKACNIFVKPTRECRIYDGITAFYDLSILKDDDVSQHFPYFQFTVVDFDSFKGSQSTSKSIEYVLGMLKGGACFIVIVMVAGEVHGSVMLEPSDHDDFKTKTKDMKQNMSIQINPFVKRNFKKSCLTRIVMEYFVPVKDLEKRMKDYMIDENTPKKTLKFLNEDRSVMSQPHYKELMYTSRARAFVGNDNLLYQDGHQGDFTIFGVLIEAKMSGPQHKRGKGHRFDIRGRYRVVTDFNQVHAYMISIPPNNKRPPPFKSSTWDLWEEEKMNSSFYDWVAFLPSRCPDGLCAFAPLNSKLHPWRREIGFHFDHTTRLFSAAEHQYVNAQTEALIINWATDDKETTKARLESKLKEWKKRPEMSEAEKSRIRLPSGVFENDNDMNMIDEEDESIENDIEDDIEDDNIDINDDEIAKRHTNDDDDDDDI